MSEQAQTVKIAKIPADGVDREVVEAGQRAPGTGEVTDAIIEALRADAVTS